MIFNACSSDLEVFAPHEADGALRLAEVKELWLALTDAVLRADAALGL